ncbi:putative cytochrome P450 [Daldinia eschscholtzii]|nr:putative cytochrome P450 [Daldinia eschscholtzii]
MSRLTELLDIDKASATKYAILVAIVLAIAEVTIIIYNLYFHPLRHFPGPILYRASRVPWGIQFATGRQAFFVQKLHDEYGPVVRIGPNHLSFTDPKAWKDIYGHRVGGESSMNEMTKSETFTKPIRDRPETIITMNRQDHSKFRRALSHGFSDSAMRQQEPVIAKYIDLLIRRLHEECDNGKKKCNLEAWYNWTTFDVVGDLVFGQSFHCLENIDYHPWIESLFNSVRFSAIMIALTYMGFGDLVQVIAKFGTSLRKARQFTRDMLNVRLAVEGKRDDLFEGIVKKREEWNIPFDTLTANAFILVIAGSETTATTLSGATALLLTHPDILEKLQQEVRSSFKSADEITITSVNKLYYMLAILNEALRLYPPVTSGLVRTVPKGGEHIAGQYVPGGTLVEIQQWSMNHSNENWNDPWAFQPERFLATSEAAAKAGNKLDSLQPFSTGPRNCIGRNLAYAEMRLILARIIFEFDLKLSDDSKQWIERQDAYLLWDRIPLNVTLTPVKR